MKSPDQLAENLARQWDNANTREERLTSPEAWPLRLSIGKPTAGQLGHDLDKVRSHIHAWRAVTVGTVEWEAVPYRSASEPIQIPRFWMLRRPSEWIDACETLRAEYSLLEQICSQTSPIYHCLWIRKRHLWRDKPVSAVILAARLADQLEPDCAEGRPLRALGLAGVDSKFYENHQSLLVHLLDARFDGRVGEVGLEVFLGAAREGDHWLLVADLDGGLLPFAQQRVRAGELAAMAALPGTHLVLVENERCLHQLPSTADCLAILGSGLNLSWLAAPWLRSRHVAYWGDLDTWGLQMLATARRHLPEVAPLLMDPTTFDRFAGEYAVPELHPADPRSTDPLTPGERDLMTRLAASENGRLEQEFLPRDHVHEVIGRWHAGTLAGT